MFLIDYSDCDMDDLVEISKAKRPWESIEDFILRSAFERYQRRENRNVVQFPVKKRCEE